MMKFNIRQGNLEDVEEVLQAIPEVSSIPLFSSPFPTK
jgi:hypothetical protein